MLLRGVDDNGDPVDVPVQVCGACGALVVVSEMDMDDHFASAHRADHLS